MDFSHHNRCFVLLYCNMKRTGNHQPTFHNLMRELISRFFTYNHNNIMIDVDDEEYLRQADRLIALISRNLINWAQKVTDFKGNLQIDNVDVLAIVWYHCNASV